MPGRVIILNGVSSAGKSTLARKLQEDSVSTWLHVEMDKFISFLPDGEEFNPDWFELIRIETPTGTLPRIANGPNGEKLLRAMRQFVIAAALQGLDLVVDEVCRASDIAEYRQGLAGCSLCVVKVDAPIEVLERREKARGDRLLGLAREQSTHLHEGVAYDLEIDTHALRPDQWALEIFNTLEV